MQRSTNLSIKSMSNSTKSGMKRKFSNSKRKKTSQGYKPLTEFKIKIKNLKIFIGARQLRIFSMKSKISKTRECFLTESGLK